MKKTSRQMWFREKVRVLFQDPYLSMEAKALLTLLESYASIEGNNCRPTVRTLMRHSQKSKKWVEKYLRELREMYRIAVIGKHEGRFGWTNKYRINYQNWGLKLADCDKPKKDPRGRVEKRPTYPVPSNLTGFPGNVVAFSEPDEDRLQDDPARYGQ